MPLLPLLLGVAPTVASWIMGDRTGAAVEKVTGIAREKIGYRLCSASAAD